MVAKYSDPMTAEYLKEHCRYKIWKRSSGEFDKAKAVAYCDTVKEAKTLVAALSEYEEDEQYTYEYELCADFSELKDIGIEFGF